MTLPDLATTLGWLGDLFAQHLYDDEAPLPMRRRWTFDGPEWSVVDNPDDEIAHFTLTGDFTGKDLSGSTLALSWDGATDSPTAETGTLRFAKDGSITWRNDDDTDDLTVLTAGDENDLQLGSGDIRDVIVNATGELRALVNAIEIGNTPAASGDIRVRSGFTINARNAAGDADITLIRADGGTDNVSVGADPQANAVLLGTQTGSVSTRVQDILAVGEGLGTPASAGVIRLPRDTTTGIKVRNDADDGNIDVVTWNASDQIIFGDLSASGATIVDSAGNVFIRSFGSNTFIAANDEVEFHCPLVQFDSALASATLEFETKPSGDGGVFTIRGQNATGGNGGDVVIRAASGSGSDGDIRLLNAAGDATVLRVTGVGQLAFFGGSSTGRPSITGAASPTDQAETNTVLNSIVAALSGFNLASDSRT